MNPRTTGILVLVTALLAAFVYFYEIEGGEQREQAEAVETRLFSDIEEAAISSISLTTSDGQAARLERGEEGWAMVEPLAFPADVFAADGLAGNLAELTSAAVLDDPQPPEEYGLGEGARVVRFGTADAEYTLRLGNKTPVGSNSYAQVEGRDEILTVPTYKAGSFEKSLTDLRERRILDFDTDAVRHIEASWPGGSITLERAPATPVAEGEETEASGDSTWRLTSPLEGRADDDVVNGLVSDLAFLRADGFVDRPGEALLARLETPMFEVTLSGDAEDGGEPPSWQLVVGPVHGGDKRVVRGAHASLYTIPVERLMDLPREVVAYRYKLLSKYRISEVSQIDFFFHPLVGDPVAVTAERGPDGWSSSPERAEPEKLARLVSELADLHATDILSEDATEEELAELGLAPPNTIVSIFGEAPEEESEGSEESGEGESEPTPLPRLAEIHIGDVDGSEWITARAAGDPTVYRLGYELAEHLPVSLEAFRNRFLGVGEPEVEEPAPEDDELDAEDFLTPAEESP